MTRVRLKRLWMIVAMIVMATNCFAEGEGQEIKMMDNTHKLQFILTDSKNNYVKARATEGTTGDVTVPYEVKDEETKGTKTYYVTKLENFSKAKETITSVILSEGIKEITADCFKRCGKLTSVTIPSSVDKIGGGAFANCQELETITIDTNNKSYVVGSKGGLYDYNKTELLYYPIKKAEESFSLPETVTKVNAYAFSGVKKLKEIKLSKNLEKFDAAAIEECTGLEKFALLEENDPKDGNHYVAGGMLVANGGTLVAVPYQKAKGELAMPEGSGIKTVGENAFFGCIELTSIKFVNAEKLANRAFFRCHGLTTITIPKTLTDINSNAFAESTGLRKFIVNGENPVYESQDSVLFKKATADTGKILYICPIECFKGINYKKYTMPEGVESIAENAFHGCKVEEVIFSSTVKYVNKLAFSSSHMLKAVTLNDGLETIGDNAFSDISLEKVTIPASVKTIGNSAFIKSKNNTLTEVTISGGSNLEKIGDRAFANNANLKTFTFAEGTHDKLTNIEIGAFENCTSLEKFTVPASVTKIGKAAFNNCKGLTELTFEATSESSELKFDPQVFQDCISLKHVELPENLKEVSTEAFNRCYGLTEVHIPAATTYVHYMAFKFCNSLVNISVDAENKDYSSIDGMLTSKDKTILKVFPAGKANDKIILLSPSFTTIGIGAFYSCENLKTVTIPKQVNEIRDNAFAICNNLKTIAFLSDKPVEKIAKKTGEANSTYAFLGSGYTDILKNCNIIVRNGKEDLYKNDSFWSEYSNNIVTSFKVEKQGFDGEYEEYFPMTDDEVSLLTSTSTAHTLVIPATITVEGDKTYKVSMIGDYAFEGTPKAIKEVVIEGDINYIGAWAFRKAKHFETVDDVTNVDKDNVQPIENIFFIGKNQAETELSTDRFGLNDGDLKGIYNEFWIDESDGGFKQNIYLRKSVYDQAYNTNVNAEGNTWGQWSDDLQYKIPLDFKIDKTSVYYMPFSREFDVDLRGDKDEESNYENWDAEKKCPKVIAFTSGEYKNGTANGNGIYYVLMKSIYNDLDDGVQGNGNGTFIPKNTGVLLKKVSAGSANDQVSAEFYYTIYDEEAELKAPENNLMVSVTERDGKLTSAGDYWDFGFGTDNKIHRYTGTAGRTVPVHQGFLQLTKTAYNAVNLGNLSAVKLHMVFDDNETTGIEDVKTDVDADNGAYYTLQGIKVARPTQGIYIHNGKKTVVK